MKWEPIETAPKNIVSREAFGSKGSHFHEYGPYILACSECDSPRRMRWWQVNDDVPVSNFLGDCGNAFFPTHWMPLPEPPQ
jgi:hypothetical protein